MGTAQDSSFIPGTFAFAFIRAVVGEASRGVIEPEKKTVASREEEPVLPNRHFCSRLVAWFCFFFFSALNVAER